MNEHSNKEYNSSDLLLTSNTYWFKHKRANGYLIERFFDGTEKSRVKLINGKKQDTLYERFHSQKIKAKLVYKNNRLHGTQVGFHDNGRTAYLYQCIDGKITGRYVEYYRNGQSHVTRVYNKDKIQSESLQTIHGDYLKHYQWVNGEKIEFEGNANCAPERSDLDEIQ